MIRPAVVPANDNGPFANNLNKAKPRGPRERRRSTKQIFQHPQTFSELKYFWCIVVFLHLSHVGFDPSTGNFDMNNISSEWKQLLDYVGVTHEQLKDKKTAEFIYNFVEEHGADLSYPSTSLKGWGSSSTTTSTTNRHQASAAAPPVPDSRSNLLSSIRAGIQLKTVSVDDSRESCAPSDDLDGMAGALARALAMCNNVMQHSDDEDDDARGDEEDEDECWGCSPFVFPLISSDFDRASGATSLESCFREMVADLQSQLNLDDISVHLYSAALISPTEHDEVNNHMLSNHARITKLLSAVEKAIRIDAKNFSTFLNVLDKTPRYRPIARRAREKLGLQLQPSVGKPVGTSVGKSVGTFVGTSVSAAPLSGKIQDADIARIAEELPQWQIVARYLDMDIEDIENNNRAPADQRKSFLRKWIRRDGSAATYEWLSKVLKMLGEEGAADKICGIKRTERIGEEN
eukprot:Em0009g1084a